MGFPQDLNLSHPCNLSLQSNQIQSLDYFTKKYSNIFVQSISFERYLNLSILCIVISSHQAGRQVCLLKENGLLQLGWVLFHQDSQMFSFSQTSIQVIPVLTYRISLQEIDHKLYY